MKWSIEEIEKTVCRGELIEPVMLHTKGRKDPYVTVRQMIMTLAVEHGYSLSFLGAYFGRGHATAINAQTSIYNRVDTEKVFRDKFETYRQMLFDKQVFKVSFLSAELDRLKKETAILQEQLSQIVI